jgi:hypothetical protein
MSSTEIGARISVISVRQIHNLTTTANFLLQHSSLINISAFKTRQQLCDASFLQDQIRVVISLPERNDSAF